MTNRHTPVRLGALLSLGVALFPAACGDDSSTTSGGGGAGGETSGSTLAGGESSVARGAWSLTFQSPGSACKVATHVAAVGTAEASGPLQYETDGVDQAAITCAVVESGDGFDVTASVSYRGQTLEISVADLRADTDFGSPATGSATFMTGQTADEYTSSSCIFYFDGDQTIEPGEVWGSFQCDEVERADSVCTVSQGYFALADCETQ
jgi:hypothetical protein